MDNRLNLAPTALAELLARYDGTRMGRQELYGELLEDVENALWSNAIIDKYRVKHLPQDVVRTVVAVDPAISADGDETGIVVACRDRAGDGYVIADYSMQGTPDQWARKVVEVYDRHEADAVVVEINQGGLRVAQTLRTVRQHLPIREVRATKGKAVRAEPISALYEQGRVHHVGPFPELETQLTSWTPDFGKSPDRLDALVWAFTELMNKSNAQAFLAAVSKTCKSCGFPNRLVAVACERCALGLE
jgi:phage terminase large subunit-like protein